MTCQYYFNIDNFDVETMMDSGLVIDFDYREEGDETFMLITTKEPCDDWFS
jgi:hypothetical protein